MKVETNGKQTTYTPALYACNKTGDLTMSTLNEQEILFLVFLIISACDSTFLYDQEFPVEGDFYRKF